MPPLKEEATPNGTPFGTLTRTPGTISHEATLSQQVVDVAEEGAQRAEEKGEKGIVHFGKFPCFFL